MGVISRASKVCIKTILGITLMAHWVDSAASRCRDALPNGLQKRCNAKKICPYLAKNDHCNKRWISMKPDTKCSYLVKAHQRFKRVKQSCQKACKVCGNDNLLTPKCIVNITFTSIYQQNYKTFLKFISIADGKWSKWSDWSSCSKSCGWGKQRRSRSCNNPKSKGVGKKCSGRSKDSKVCSKQSICSK